jgi:hypothetical protein
LDELYNKWFNKRVSCIKKASDDKIRIDFAEYKGVYIFLLIGMALALIVLMLEQALYAWTIPFLRNKPKKSKWIDFRLMFMSQVGYFNDYSFNLMLFFF